jgi:protein-S-isoprenylcysteine O-methyltransferase Ste14
MILGFRIGLLNLWLPFVIGYGLIWLASSLSSRGIKRQSSAGPTNEYVSKRLMHIFGFYPFLSLLFVSIFVPFSFGILFWPGILIFIFGIGLNIIVINSFIRSDEELKTKGPYRYSRNPMYVANFIYIAGLNLMGWAGTLANMVFVILTLYWIGGTHWCVLREETFLEQKFGETYLRYKKQTPRWIGFYNKEVKK